MGQLIAQAQVVEQGAAVGDIFRCGNRCGRHRHVMTGEHLAWLVIVAIAGGLRIRMECLQQ
jgi:hypothetical protein